MPKEPISYCPPIQYHDNQGPAVYEPIIVTTAVENPVVPNTEAPEQDLFASSSEPEDEGVDGFCRV